MAVIEKKILAQWIDKLEAAGISFDSITLDWFALNPNELVLTPNALLVNTDSFQGALSKEVLPLFSAEWAPSSPCLQFVDSLEVDGLPCAEKSKESVFVWIARRLLVRQPINLCQGDWLRASSRLKLKRWVQASGALFLALLLSPLVFNAFNVALLSYQIKKVDKAIAVVFTTFFPVSKQVVNPRFRITQLLNNNFTPVNQTLWHLLSKLADSFASNQFTVQQLRFQTNQLVVALQLSDFQSLETLVHQLNHTGVKVKQQQALSEEEHVLATLELSE